jgi:glycosyltransferase 2 family protein
VLIGGAIALVLSWLAATAQDSVSTVEQRIFEAINGLPDALWPLVWLPMQLGTFGASLLVVAVVGFASRDRRLTLAVLVATQAAYWVTKAVKAIVARGRPASFLSDVEIRDRTRGYGYGYASGHTAMAFALAAAIAPSLPPRLRPFAYALAAVVGFARVYAGVHLPLDVVGGIGIGLLCGTLARRLFDLDHARP